MERLSEDEGRGAGRRRALATAASLALHAVALGWLALNAARLHVTPPPAAAQPVLEVRLSPGLRPTSATGLAHASAELRPSRGAPRPASARTTAPAPSVPAPAASAPSAPSPPAAGAGAGAATAQGAQADAGDAAVRAALRALTECGSAATPDLAPAERARCAERLGLAARTAPRIDPIPAAKRAYYDAVAAAYAKARAPPPNGPPRLGASSAERLVADRGGGLTLPLAACAMKFGAPRGWKSYHDVPPHSLKLGKIGSLPCFIPPPNGRFTEESSVEAPPSLREQTDDAAHMRALDPPPAPH